MRSRGLSKRSGVRTRLKKSLGQHHLTSGSLCRPLIEFLAPAGKEVLEIGPGGGVLSRELLAVGAARVCGWELDLGWVFALRRALPEPRLVLVAGDALELSWNRLREPTLVAGNLPYQVATALIERLLPHWCRVPRAGFLVQREVAARLVAGPGSSSYGALSVLTQARARVAVLGRVRPGSFRPPPRVESAFVGLELHAPPLPESEMPAFVETVRAAFALRRKTLRNALGAAWGIERAAHLLAALELPPESRAHELSLDRFLVLHRLRLAC